MISVPDIHEQFIKDEDGNKITVVISPQTYRLLLEALEELESIKAYDEAKASGDEAVPLAQALTEIRSPRQ